MSITIFKGLPGSGKSSRLIELVNNAIEQGQPVQTFVCSDFPWLIGYHSYSAQRRLGCRRPGLSCSLDHFVSTDEFTQILELTPTGTLIAVDEAQSFGADLVSHWVKASNRGLDLVLVSPSSEQVKLLQGHEYNEVLFTITCQRCERADAVTVVIPPEAEATLSLCNECFNAMAEEAQKQIVEYLREELPHRGKEALYQPVELPECNDWPVSRPDSQARADIVLHILDEVGLLDNNRAGNPTYIDIGCSTGFFCSALQRHGFYANGIDAAEKNILIAKLLDSFVRRRERPNKKFVTYKATDAYEYLRDTQHELFDVTSAFSVFQWVMSQRSVEHAVSCFEWMFAKTKSVCILEMGYSSQDNYATLLPINVDRSWVLKVMEEKGDFAEIRVIDGQKNGLMRDLFIGLKTPVRKLAENRSLSTQPDSEGKKIGGARNDGRQVSLSQPPDSSRRGSVLKRLVWQKDRMLLDDLVFRLQHYKSDDWDLGDECFTFYKTEGLVNQYASFLALRENFQPQNVLELGIWEGGSMIFWFECLQPQKHVAIDLSRRGDPQYFQQYVKSRGLEGRIKSYWGINQADKQKLGEIVESEFHGQLDLVIDDASHLYGPTKSSFETLFPLVRPGGFYIIEDWAWAHWPEVIERDAKWMTSKPVTNLVCELVEAIGSSSLLIKNISVHRGFIAIERGEIGRVELNGFKLNNFIFRKQAGKSKNGQTYQELVSRMRQIVNANLPSNSTLLIVSKGDDDLLKIDSQQTGHFPQTEEGWYTGAHPADSSEVISHLESLRSKGGDYLLFPKTAFWWLDYYGDFRHHLDARYQRIWNDDSCIIYQLS
jgi:SAM-dependent methyltransferase